MAIVKDEAPYLAEWVAFHRLQGFDRFLIYDNESSDDSAQIAKEAGCETYPWPGHIQQIAAYMDACDKLEGVEPWVAFIDVDEYLWCPTGQRVVDKLLALVASEPAVAYGAPWVMFGSNGHIEPPGRLTIEAYTRRETHANAHVKQILRPEFVRTWEDPHATNAPFQRTDAILCNHYFTRSETECRAKFKRGRADYFRARQMPEFYALDPIICATEDTRLAEMWGRKLRRALKAA